MCGPRLLGVELALHVKDVGRWSFIDPLLWCGLVLRLRLLFCTISLLSQHSHLTSISKMSKRFSTADVAAHKTADDLYIIVDEDVYDLTKFADEHPGGKKSMKPYLATACHQLTDHSPDSRCWQGCKQTILEGEALDEQCASYGCNDRN